MGELTFGKSFIIRKNEIGNENKFKKKYFTAFSLFICRFHFKKRSTRIILPVLPDFNKNIT